MCSPSVYANPGCPARDSCDLLALLALLQGPHRVTDRLVMILLSHHDLPATDGQRPNRPAEGAGGGQQQADQAAQQQRAEHPCRPAWVADQAGQRQRAEGGTDPDGAQQPQQLISGLQAGASAIRLSHDPETLDAGRPGRRSPARISAEA